MLLSYNRKNYNDEKYYDIIGLCGILFFLVHDVKTLIYYIHTHGSPYLHVNQDT